MASRQNQGYFSFRQQIWLFYMNIKRFISVLEKYWALYICITMNQHIFINKLHFHDDPKMWTFISRFFFLHVSVKIFNKLIAENVVCIHTYTSYKCLYSVFRENCGFFFCTIHSNPTLAYLMLQDMFKVLNAIFQTNNSSPVLKR